MFGYIRPLTEELKVCEYSYYRAVYCGLCHEMARTLGRLAPLTLRYDFVFLTLVRAVLTEEPLGISSARCMASPLRRRPCTESSASARFAARCAGLLTLYGVRDNIADERGLRRLLYRLAGIPAGHWYRRASAPAAGAPLAEEDREVQADLAALSALEHAGEPSPDAAAEPFGALLGTLFAAQLPEEPLRRIAHACGSHTGRFIYLCDAVDDAEKDAADGAYNPVVLQAKQAGMTVSAYLADPVHAERLRCAMLLECEGALRAMELAPGAERHPAWAPLYNILTLGMPRMAEHVLLHPGEKLPGSDPGIRP